ncbi:MAG: hypothetical protein M0025_08630 [Elusimicrobia bacterium]|nr:hypothetical protein [Elusimicrobiota bacterium]
MSDSEDMKYLLDRLKSEVGPVREEGREPLPRPMPDRAAPQPAPAYEGFRRPYRAPEQPERRPLPSGWSENKEMLLFGMLASLIAALGGILAGLGYVVAVGTASFGLFALVTAVALMKICLFRPGQPQEDSALNARLDALSRRVEALSNRAVSVSSGHQAAAPDPELERKVEELRVLMKSLAKAVESGR